MACYHLEKDLYQHDFIIFRDYYFMCEMKVTDDGKSSNICK